MPSALATDKRFIGARAIASADKEEDAPYGSVTGICNALEVDRYGDLVLTEALMAAVPKYLKNAVLSFGHGIDGNPQNGTMPAGTVLSMAPDLEGNTTFRARWANTPDAQMTRQLYKDGDMRAFSIHFLPYGDSLVVRDPTSQEVAQYPGVKRVIAGMELIEIACAVVPVNAGSLSTGAKSLNQKLTHPKKLSKPSSGERAMPKSILTGDQRKAIDGARSAYEGHAKAMEGVASHLEELAESKEGAEADHGSMCDKCKDAFGKMEETHGKLGEAIKSMRKAITNQDDEPAEGDDDGEGKPEDGDAAADGSGSPPMPATEEGKAFKSLFDKALGV